MNYLMLCRCCLKQIAQEDPKESSQRMMDMFLFCVQFQQCDKDGLPKSFCSSCSHQIKLVYEFIKEAQTCHKKLQNIVFQHKQIENTKDFDNENDTIDNKSEIKLKYLDLYDISSFVSVEESKSIDEYFNVEVSSSLNKNCDIGDSEKDIEKKTIDMQICKVDVENINNSNESETEDLQQDFQCTDPIDEEVTQYNSPDHVILSETSSKEPHKNVNNENSKGYEKNNILPELISKNLETITLKSRKPKSNKAINRTVTCPECNKIYSNQRFLKIHIIRKHNKPTTDPTNLEGFCSIGCFDEKPFSCNTCGKKFKQHKGLAVHSITHSDVRPFVCDYCQMSFKMKQVLLKHLRTHESYFRFLCHVCAKGFKNQHNLSEHMATHTGEKRFSCPKCGYRAAHRSTLRRHAARHSTARGHVCPQCRRAFKQRSALTRHARIHTGEKPFRCPHCPLAFIDHWKRKTHLMRVHQLPFGEIPRLAADGQPLPKW